MKQGTVLPGPIEPRSSPEGAAKDPSPVFSIVVLTYARDEVVKRLLVELAGRVGDRADYEVILVDNNADEVDRSAWLKTFPRGYWLRIGFNKGVVARNDGMAAARGQIVVLIDDDCFVQTPAFLDQFAAAFATDPEIGAVTSRKLIAETMAVRRDIVPHTRKHIDLLRPFLTFRIVGGVLAFRMAMVEKIGAFTDQIFYGLEEIDYAYRIVEAGWKILYTPNIVSLELEHKGGRRPARETATTRLTNKYIISYMHMPFPYVILNFVLFTPYAFAFYRGQTDVLGAVAAFARWLGRRDRPRRQPIGRQAQAYIRACGGSLWR